MFKVFEEFDDLEEMRESQQLENHASLVMYTIDEAIASIEDVDFVVELLRKIGRTHTMANFNSELFWKIEQPFLQAVKETLEDRYTKNMEEIYKITFRFIVETLIGGVKAATDDSKKLDNEEENANLETNGDLTDIKETNDSKKATINHNDT